MLFRCLPTKSTLPSLCSPPRAHRHSAPVPPPTPCPYHAHPLVLQVPQHRGELLQRLGWKGDTSAVSVQRFTLKKETEHAFCVLKGWLVEGFYHLCSPPRKASYRSSLSGSIPSAVFPPPERNTASSPQTCPTQQPVTKQPYGSALTSVCSAHKWQLTSVCSAAGGSGDKAIFAERLGTNK